MQIMTRSWTQVRRLQQKTVHDLSQRKWSMNESEWLYHFQRKLCNTGNITLDTLLHFNEEEYLLSSASWLTISMATKCKVSPHSFITNQWPGRIRCHHWSNVCGALINTELSNFPVSCDPVWCLPWRPGLTGFVWHDWVSALSDRRYSEHHLKRERSGHCS